MSVLHIFAICTIIGLVILAANGIRIIRIKNKISQDLFTEHQRHQMTKYERAVAANAPYLSAARSALDALSGDR